MARVRMLQKISGTRRGRHWPDPGGEIDVTEGEARMLTRQKMARRLAEPTAESSAQEGQMPPAHSDLKAAWVDYAVSQGMEESDAAAMTKANLVERFGE